MQIFVKMITGKIIVLNVEPFDTIESLKLKIQVKEGFLKDNQRLTFAGKLLYDNITLRGYNVQENANLDLIIGMRHRVEFLC